MQEQVVLLLLLLFECSHIVEGESDCKANFYLSFLLFSLSDFLRSFVRFLIVCVCVGAGERAKEVIIMYILQINFLQES